MMKSYLIFTPAFPLERVAWQMSYEDSK